VQLGGKAMGGLPSFCPAGLERVRDHLPVCRRHCRAVAAWRQTRTGSGGLGFTLEGRRVLLHLMAGSKKDAETVHELSHRVVHVNRNSPVVLRAELCFTINLMRT
jgi:hypothetical protein